MNLLRREVGRRVVLREIAIPGEPAARAPPADAVVGSRQVLAIHELEQLRECGLHARADAVDAGLRQTLAIGGRQRAGNGAERAVVAALLGRLRGELRDLRPHALGDDFRQEHVGLHALAHQRDVLIHVRGKCVETRKPVVEVLHRLEAQRIDEELGALHAVERRGANQVLPMLKAFHRHLILVAEEVVVEAIGRRELCARDRGEIFQHRLAVRLARGERAGADVGPPVVPAAVAEVGRPQRILRELPLPFAIEQRMQRGARGVGVRRFLSVRDGGERHADEDEEVFQLHKERV